MWTLAALIVAGASGAASPPLSDAIQRVDPIEYRVELKGWVCVYAPNEATDHTPGDAAPLYLPFVAEGAYLLKSEFLKKSLEVE